MKINFSNKPKSVSAYIPAEVMAKWNPNLKIKSEVKAANTIEILDSIGFDYFEGGVTASSINSQLNEIGEDEPVTVLINSGGGDVFEGIAIYNLLNQHKGEVTVKVLGLAASAASIIAMAGDEIKIDPSSFFMIHNAWVVAQGDRNDFLEVSEFLAPIDAAMADVYKAKSGLDLADIVNFMNGETWFNGTDALDKGFATGMLSDEVIEEEENSVSAALRQVEAVLRNANFSRKETKALLKELKSSKPSAADQDDKLSAISLGECVALATDLE